MSIDWVYNAFAICDVVFAKTVKSFRWFFTKKSKIFRCLEIYQSKSEFNVGFKSGLIFLRSSILFEILVF